jgi:hypothetical protein
MSEWRVEERSGRWQGTGRGGFDGCTRWRGEVCRDIEVVGRAVADLAAGIGEFGR